jgi:uncharacterized protein YebE (UPF0316 family)
MRYAMSLLLSILTSFDIKIKMIIQQSLLQNHNQMEYNMQKYDKEVFMIEDILKEEWFVLYGIPLLIALARIVDVSIGTLRIIFVAKGLRLWAPILGFFEVSIWLAAISQVMANINSITNFFAYAIGFSLGNYLGMFIENKLALGHVVVRIITKRDATRLIAKLRRSDYNVTVADAEGNMGEVSVIFTVIKRSRVTKIVRLIKHYNPRAVYSIEDVRYVSDTTFATKAPRVSKNFTRLLPSLKK